MSSWRGQQGALRVGASQTGRRLQGALIIQLSYVLASGWAPKSLSAIPSPIHLCVARKSVDGLPMLRQERTERWPKARTRTLTAFEENLTTAVVAAGIPAEGEDAAASAAPKVL